MIALARVARPNNVTIEREGKFGGAILTFRAKVVRPRARPHVSRRGEKSS